MVTITNAENALKSVYLGALSNIINTKANPLLAKIEQSSADVYGKEIRRAVCVGINGGFGAGDEAGNLPSANGNNYVQLVATLKNLFGQIEISDKAIRASAHSAGAFTDLLDAELTGLLDACKFNLGRMLYGDGSGLLCTVTSNLLANSAYSVSSLNNIIEGMVVDVYHPSTDNLTHTLRIESIDRDSKTVKFNTLPSPDITSGAKLYVQGSRDKELTGLGALFSTKKIYGVDREQNPSFMPYMKNIATQIDEVIIQEAIDKLDNHYNSQVDFIACSADVKYAYQEYMSQYKRNIDIMELDGGFKTLSFNGLPLVYDRFVKDGVMYLLNTKAFKLHQLCDWRYLENENGKILRQIPGKAAYTATLVKYCDLICDKPNGQAMLSGIVR